MANVTYQREIINQACIDMLSLCISQIEKAKEAFVTHDSDLAEEVMNIENRVNALDLKIEKDCEKFIALYNPVAIDLRFVMAIRKVNYNLERIADHAYGMAKYVVDIDKKIPSHLIEAVDFEKMFETIEKMLESISDAFQNKDAKSARKVFKKDKIVDEININSFAVIETEIKKDTAIIGEALLLFSVIKKMERVGDHIKNIAEEIIFYIDAEVIKHKRKK
jgi:phosphate transport system protein